MEFRELRKGPSYPKPDVSKLGYIWLIISGEPSLATKVDT